MRIYGWTPAALSQLRMPASAAPAPAGGLHLPTLLLRVLFVFPWVGAGLACFLDGGRTLDDQVFWLLKGLAFWGAPPLAAPLARYVCYAGAALGLSGAAAAVQPGGERCGAAMLAAFLLFATPVVHWPLTGAGGALDVEQLKHFTKNVALLGGCAMLWNEGCDYVARKKAGAAATKAAAAH